MPEIVEQLVFSQPIIAYQDKWSETPEPEGRTAAGKLPEATPDDNMPVHAYPEAPDYPEYRIVGEVFTSYIVAECGNEVIFIDKHAAHERLLFDRLKSEEREMMSQQLLTPLIAEPGHEDAELLLSNIPLLDSLGFEIEDFGGGTVMLRRLPADMGTGDAAAVLS
jgi:DNA mismatch repair protein MutL